MNKCPWPTPGKKKGSQISDLAEVEKILRDVLAKNPAAVAEYKGAEAGAFNALIGRVMKATHGKANPQLVDEVLKRLLTAF